MLIFVEYIDLVNRVTTRKIIVSTTQMKKQRSRLRWLKEGDANSKLFHLVANGRRSKNCITAVRYNGRLATSQEEKHEAFDAAYAALVGEIICREHTVDLTAIGLQRKNLEDLNNLFTEEEVWKVILELLPDRAPGPDEFIGLFYQKAWSIIKRDVMAALLKLAVGDGRGFGKLNRSLITLIPKKPDAMEIGDFCPISLVYSFAKLFSKLLANRLRPRMSELVSSNQSAFIVGRSPHDNFVLVREVARRINHKRIKGVFLKLDISRAFDSLSWYFLFEILRHLGFGDIWLKWISLLLSSATMRILVNGVPGARIKYARGLRQGDPTSPQLFVMAMEVLTLLIAKAAEEGLMSVLPGCALKQRILVYADDIAIFVRPFVQDLTAVKEILGVFGRASGLSVNYSKSSAIVIRGDAQDDMIVKHFLQCRMDTFPCKYLGLQLSLNRLNKVDWQPFLDKIIAFLPPGNGVCRSDLGG
jgi:hypothetical protein